MKKGVPGAEEKIPASFESATNQTIDIDANYWPHRLCSKPQNALMITYDPPPPPTM